MGAVSVTRASIERVVHRWSWSTWAEFQTGEMWWCTAYKHPGKPFQIQARGNEMTPEDAATVIIALQLALEWIAEESQQ